MKELDTLSLTALLALSTSGALFAQSQGPLPRVPESQARAVALAAVPGGKVLSEEFEHENGHDIYSYDIKVKGQTGIEEINVDAHTGQVLAHEHEGPSAERQEARQEGQPAGEVRQAGEPEGAEAVSGSYAPRIEPANFVSRVTNPYLPLVPGTTYRFRGTGANRGETDVVTVTAKTRRVMGISATVVHDQVFENGALAEDTYDWYAQDRQGNVWYLGEATKELRNGRVTSTEGSWESGVKGAQPGIAMWADPAAHRGRLYRQEYLPGIAEDMGKVVALQQTVTAPAGTYHDCIETEDTTPLEPNVREHKFYCKGVGVVREQESPSAGSELLVVEKH